MFIAYIRNMNILIHIHIVIDFAFSYTIGGEYEGSPPSGSDAERTSAADDDRDEPLGDRRLLEARLAESHQGVFIFPPDPPFVIVEVSNSRCR